MATSFKRISKMKGIILAGGLGKRLYPLTRITNKHILPVWNKPMIYYPLQKLGDAGIKDILIVTGPEHADHFKKLLKNGEEFNVNIQYKLQKEPRGIAHALGLAESFADNENIAVILGDNIFEDNLDLTDFNQGARIFLKELKDPTRFGVAEINKDKIISIEEKPKHPKSNYAVTGCYLYDNNVFDIIKTLTPSKRNELEITDVNNAYIKQGKMAYKILGGFWSDAGTFESLFNATKFLRDKT